MQIKSLYLKDFRNLTTSVEFAPGFALIVGENNTGKSNIIDALRILLTSASGPRDQRYPTNDDFVHDEEGSRIAESFTLEVSFVDLNFEEEAQMVTCLTPSLGPGTAKIGLISSVERSGPPSLMWYGGDNENPDVEPFARQAARYTYLPALRDAKADLSPGRTNLLVRLVSALAVNDDDRRHMEALVDESNKHLAKEGPITRAREEIQTRLDKLAGPVYRQQTDVAFAEPQFTRIVGSLRALIGDHTPLEMTENGLGLNNLLYMATLLAGVTEESQTGLNVLLVEEPEAHLHPQLQDLLMEYLSSGLHTSVQVIATTHSPNFASGAGVDRITLHARSSSDTAVSSTPLFGIDLNRDERLHLQRFLDVTKAALLFSRAVLLVEGLAEQLILPDLARALKIDLKQSGIAVINIGGLSFRPFARLFGPGKLPYRCAIMSDSDPVGAAQGDGGEDASLSATAQSLMRLRNENLEVFLSQKTFEWDFVKAGNWDVALKAVALIQSQSAKRLGATLEAAPLTAKADALLHQVERYKGRFAQAVVQVLSSGHSSVIVPQYIVQALQWLTGSGHEPTAIQETLDASR